MELRHLRYFVTVAEELSFRRAAHRLHVSHPALSQRIHDLENELGVKLFERNSRRVEMTEIGRVFLGGARRALEAAKQAVTVAREAAKGERGRLVIGCIGPMVGSFLPDALARFREQRPLVEATVSHMNSRTQIEALLDGSIMLGIGNFGSVIDKDERDQLCSHLLIRAPLGIACSKHRRFPRRAAPKLKDFRNDIFLCFEPEHASEHENRLRELCRRVGGFDPQIGPRVNSPESLVSMIAAGRGVFLGVELGIRGRATAIDFYPLNEPESQFELSAIWKNQPQGDSTIIRKFIDVMDESIKLSGVV
ncbi:MAG TPA: LysR substrate-binding domain-containing protein [Chthoniobacterales bacterium]|jgi:DNA-binding transcriptional LysR family regulator|nr:LysR substrate-binding domain-containing protein [Chthoniobacterales bacterium]